MIIEATSHEARVLQQNVTSHPGLLSVVLGMLSIRFSERDVMQPGEDLLQHALFKSNMREAGEALKSLQNCVEKPPLSQGTDYINDQIAVLKLPVLIGDLFAAAGFEPVVQIKMCPVNSGFLASAQHLYTSIAMRSGFSFNFVQQAGK